MMEQNLGVLRQQIDQDNQAILEAFIHRMQVSEQIASYKKEHHLPVFDADRENRLLAAIAEMTPEKWQRDSRALFNRLMQLSRGAQKRVLHPENPYEKIIAQGKSRAMEVIPPYQLTACQGTAGAYAQKAAEKILDCPRILYFETFEGVFRALEQGLCRYAVLPIENSTAGSVNRVYDLMLDHKCSILRSYRLKVDHCLMTRSDVKISDVTDIYSHEQAIAQCSNFLQDLGKQIRVHAVRNTAEAAQMVADENSGTAAAICSHDCASLYHLNPLAEHIQNQDNNYTRFICVTKETEIMPGADRVSIMLTLPHRAGSLYEAMSIIDQHCVNLEKLESRPIPDRDFEFMFYFDLRVSSSREDLPELLRNLEEISESFRFLGAYSEVV